MFRRFWIIAAIVAVPLLSLCALSWRATAGPPATDVPIWPGGHIERPVGGRVTPAEAFLLVQLVGGDGRVIAETFTNPQGRFTFAPLSQPVSARVFRVLTKEKQPVALEEVVLFHPKPPENRYQLKLQLDEMGEPIYLEPAAGQERSAPVSDAVRVGARLNLQNANHQAPAAKQGLSTLQLVESGIITGIVTAADTGMPLSGYVAVYDRNEATSDDQPPNPVGLFYFDNYDGGIYTVDGLEPGEYYLKFVPAADSGYLPEFYADKTTLADADPVALGSDQAMRIDVELERGGILQGTVTELDGGDILGTGSGIYIHLYDAQDNDYLDYDYSDDEGTYFFNGLGTGNYKLYFGVDYDADTNAIPEYYHRQSHLNRADPILVNQGVTTTIDYAMRSGAVISGVITAEGSHEPLEDVYIGLERLDECDTWYYVDSTYSDSDGWYTFNRLEPGQYRLIFENAAWLSGNGRHFLDGGEEMVTLAVEENKTINRTLVKGGLIVGRVTGSDTSGPLEGIWVGVYQPVTNDPDTWYDYAGEAWTDANGYYTSSALLTGDYRVWFAISRSEPSAAYVEKVYGAAPGQRLGQGDPVAVVEGEETILDETLVHGGQVSGRVTAGDTGLPLPNVSVRVFETLSDGSDYYWAYGWTDHNGVYTTTGSPAGDYLVEFDARNDWANYYIDEYYDNKAQQMDGDLVTVKEQKSTSGIDAILDRGGAIIGSVNVAGFPDAVLYPEVIIYDHGGSWVDSDFPDYEGRYYVGGLRPGTYYVRFGNYPLSNPAWLEQVCGIYHYVGEYYDRTPYFAQAEPLLISGTETIAGIDGTLSTDNLPPDYPYQTLYTVSGLVKDGGGQPIAGVKIRADTGQVATTLANGTYSLRLAAGSYTLTPMKNGYTFTPAERPLTVSGDTSGQDFTGQTTPPSAAISGHVSAAAYQAQGLAPNQALEGIKVQVYQYDNNTWDFAATTSTGADGRYQVGSLYPGSYRVYFRDPANRYLDEYYDDTTHFEHAQTLVLAAGQSAADVDAVLTERQPPKIEVSGDGQTTVDPETGKVTVRLPFSANTTLTFRRKVVCESGGTPADVTLIAGTRSFAMSHQGNGVYEVTLNIPGDLPEGARVNLSVRYECDGQTSFDGVGEIERYDPSGLIRDEETGTPIAGAIVTLYRVPGAAPDKGEQTNDCRTVDSRPTVASGPFGAWSGVAAADPLSGNAVNGDIDRVEGVPVFDPLTNPQVTGSDGYYGWDVVEGCWYVTVEAEGYPLVVSPVVGVPPAVTDLDIYLSGQFDLFLPMIVRAVP